MGISNEPIEVIENFIEDQGITFPVLRDNAGVYSSYNIPGGQSPYPRDYIIDGHGILHLAKTEYDPGEMINVIERLFDNDVVNTATDLNLHVPETIKLLPNFPNPFNPATTLQFSLSSSASISLDVVNLKGSVVARIYTNQFFPKGTHKVKWNGVNDYGDPLSSGHYFVRLRRADSIITRKVMLIK
ncbi:MAG: T9SS type A sorting domain-containing protein [Candidatus Marinimicrobia bacterium]|nr:T9SS type A sorting domain-containing protein [Candidatus Neomarinimicrobiota bacterium]